MDLGGPLQINSIVKAALCLAFGVIWLFVLVFELQRHRRYRKKGWPNPPTWWVAWAALVWIGGLFLLGAAFVKALGGSL